VGGGPASLPGVILQAPRTERYLVETHACKAGDSWEALSKEKYGDATAAAALREFNQNYPRADGLIRAKGEIAPGEKVYIPPLKVLERHGLKLGSAPAKPGSAAATSTLPGMPGK
jgi:hypothetical protein